MNATIRMTTCTLVLVQLFIHSRHTLAFHHTTPTTRATPITRTIITRPAFTLFATRSNSNRKNNPKPINAKDWPRKFPAKEHCSKCGLCETTFVQHVDTSCSFLKEGMSRIDDLELHVHGTTRLLQSQQHAAAAGNGMNGTRASTDSDNDNSYSDRHARFGVMHEEFPVMLVKGTQRNSQWTGVVTSIAISMLESGLVDAVVCIANAASSGDEHGDGINANSKMPHLEPKPIVARTIEEILLGRGVKPSLAPSLAVLDEIKQDVSIRRLLFCGVGCAVQAFRSPDVQDALGLEKVYVLGTNCADNSPSSLASADFISSGLDIDESELKSVKGYEFMQDFQVHVKKNGVGGDDDDIVYEKIPYFSLPGKIAQSSIADSCLACFDYTNALADVVVGYMGAPLDGGGKMDSTFQTLTVRNDLGKEMVDVALKSGRLEVSGEATGVGKWQDFAVQTVVADGIVAEMVGERPKEAGMPRWIGGLVAKVVTSIGPKGMNFASYSIDYHILRNYLHVISEWGEERGEASMPQYAKSIVREYLDRDKEFRRLRDRVLKKGGL
jgi:coenzyme F420-reducing hydrogenase beta subunit